MSDIDQQIMRQVMNQATADLFASPSATAAAIKRQRHNRVRTRVLGIAGTAAAAGLAVGTVATVSGPGTRPAAAPARSALAGHTTNVQLTAAERTLDSLSAAAAATHRPSGRYVVLTEKSTGTDGAVTETGGRTSVIDTVTGGGVTYQGITVSGAGSTPTPPSELSSPAGTSPTIAQLDALPTSPTALRAVLLAQSKQQYDKAYKLEAKAKKTGQAYPALVPGNPPTDDDQVYDQATDLLWVPDISPALRSALYKVLAATPGVIVNAHAADSTGRPAIEISRFDTAAKTDVETFENPTTGATLESAWDGPSSNFSEDLYLSIAYTNTIPANPYQQG